jgi:hypothetical protein
VRRREVQPQADAAAGEDIILVSQVKLGQKMPRGGAKNTLYDTLTGNKITRFLGCSENAVKMQIYVAMMAFFLLRMFHDSPASNHKAGAKALMARPKLVLLQKFDLTNRAKPPPPAPCKRSPSPQLSLLLAT